MAGIPIHAIAIGFANNINVLYCRHRKVTGHESYSHRFGRKQVSGLYSQWDRGDFGGEAGQNDPAFWVLGPTGAFSSRDGDLCGIVGHWRCRQIGRARVTDCPRAFGSDVGRRATTDQERSKRCASIERSIHADRSTFRSSSVGFRSRDSDQTPNEIVLGVVPDLADQQRAGLDAYAGPPDSNGSEPKLSRTGSEPGNRSSLSCDPAAGANPSFESSDRGGGSRAGGSGPTHFRNRAIAKHSGGRDVNCFGVSFYVGRGQSIWKRPSISIVCGAYPRRTFQLRKNPQDVHYQSRVFFISALSRSSGLGALSPSSERADGSVDEGHREAARKKDRHCCLSPKTRRNSLRGLENKAAVSSPTDIGIARSILGVASHVGSDLHRGAAVVIARDTLAALLRDPEVTNATRHPHSPSCAETSAYGRLKHLDEILAPRFSNRTEDRFAVFQNLALSFTGRPLHGCVPLIAAAFFRLKIVAAGGLMS